MWAWLTTYWKPLCIVAALIIVGAQGYDMGASKVQQDWGAERVAIARALTANAEAQRAKEFADQQNMNKVQADATQRLEALRTDADSANAAADQLREQVGKLLAADRLRQATRACSSRTATENPGNLLAVVLDKSIERNKQLAAFADSAMTAATFCAASWGTRK